jgi:hypothetical protein
MFDVTPTALPQIKAASSARSARPTVDRARRAARPADHRRIREGLRGVRLDRLGAPKDAAGDHRNAQQADHAAVLDATIQKRLTDLGATTLPQMTPGRVRQR